MEWSRGWLCVSEFESLIEHVYQGIEVSLIIIANVGAEPSGSLAVENPQLCQRLGIANAFLYAAALEAGVLPRFLGDDCDYAARNENIS
jgi:hypothetical protein